MKSASEQNYDIKSLDLSNPEVMDFIRDDLGLNPSLNIPILNSSQRIMISKILKSKGVETDGLTNKDLYLGLINHFVGSLLVAKNSYNKQEIIEICRLAGFNLVNLNSYNPEIVLQPRFQISFTENVSAITKGLKVEAKKDADEAYKTAKLNKVEAVGEVQVLTPNSKLGQLIMNMSDDKLVKLLNKIDKESGVYKQINSAAIWNLVHPKIVQKLQGALSLAQQATDKKGVNILEKIANFFSNLVKSDTQLDKAQKAELASFMKAAQEFGAAKEKPAEFLTQGVESAALFRIIAESAGEIATSIEQVGKLDKEVLASIVDKICKDFKNRGLEVNQDFKIKLAKAFMSIEAETLQGIPSAQNRIIEQTNIIYNNMSSKLAPFERQAVIDNLNGKQVNLPDGVEIPKMSMPVRDLLLLRLEALHQGKEVSKQEEKDVIRGYAIAESLALVKAGVVVGKLKKSNNIEQSDLKGSAKLVKEAVDIVLKGNKQSVTR